MIDDAPSAGGSVPHAYRNALFWRWVPAMPKEIPAAFVTALYALASAADPAGRVRFRDGRVIRIRDIASAAKCDEKDVRRYLRAAEAAGVLVMEGERKRGRPNLYTLILSPQPDWVKAVEVIRQGRRVSRKAPPWVEENGGVDPELTEAENGGHAPELGPEDGEEERGTRPGTSSGDTPPPSSGDTPPNNPGTTQEVTQEMAEVVHLPQVPGGLAEFKATRSSLRRDRR